MQNVLSSQTLFSGGPEISKGHYNSEMMEFAGILQQKSTTSLNQLSQLENMRVVPNSEELINRKIGAPRKSSKGKS